MSIILVSKLTFIVKKQVLTFLFIFCFLISFSETAKVVRVIDGDTFETETGEHVRMLGINAPEISDEYGEAAKQHLISLLLGETIELFADHISEDRDVFGRLLRYPFLNGKDIDKQMILDGYAEAYLKYSFDKEEEYVEAENQAKRNLVGIWSAKVPFKQEVTPYKKYILIAGLILGIVGCIYYFKR